MSVNGAKLKVVINMSFGCFMYFIILYYTLIYKLIVQERDTLSWKRFFIQGK